MFKTSRKRVVTGKEKVDFKLEFHASQVPQRGWDKLLVSLISLESGKVTAKTGKVSVKNGNCNWPEPIYESATLPQDLKGKNADKQMYRIVVSMGLSRFGTLGETTINLVDHLQAIVPVSLSLPLQNCNTGSILHVKIQRIMSESASRHSEDLKESAPAQDLHAGKPDSLQSGLDSKLPVAQISDRSQHNKIEKDSSLSTSVKDDSFPPFTHRYSSDSLEIPSTPGVSESRAYGRDPLSEELMSPSSSVSSGSGRQETGAGFHDYIGFKRTQINQESNVELPPPGANKLGRPAVVHSLSSVQSSLDGNDIRQAEQWKSPVSSVWGSPGNMSSSTVSCASENLGKNQESGQKSFRLQSSNLDAAEITIRELRTEAASQEQHGKRLESEIEALKQQLVEETRKGVELQTQLTALVAERDSIKLDIENLKSSEKPSTKIGEGVVWQQVEESRSTVKELQDELEYQKSMNSNLNLQLRKTQESNSELLLEIQDLEKEIADKTELEKHRNLAKTLSDSGARESVDANVDSEKVIDALKKELEELERDSQELTEENLDLIAQLKQANDRLNGKDGIISKLESESKVLLEQSHSASSHVNKLSDSLDSADSEENKLRRTVNDLREKLRISEESAESKVASSRTLIDDLNSSVVMLRSKNAHIERQLQSFEENSSELLKEIDTLKSKNDEHEGEKSLLVSQRGQLKGLREKATKAEQDYINILKRCEELETMNQRLNEEKRRAIDSLLQQLNSTEGLALGTNKTYTDVLQLVEDLKARKLEFEMSVSLKAKEDAGVIVTQLQETNVQLQKQVHQEQLKNSQLLLESQENDAKSANLLQELYACQNEVQEMEQNSKALETLRNEMEITVQGIREENMNIRSQVKELELQIAALNEDSHFLQESRSALEARNQDLQSLNDELHKKLKNAREESSWARENTNSLVTEIRALEAVIESNALVKSEMEQSWSELEAQKVNLQSQLQNLSKENLLLKGKVVDYEAQYRNALEEKGALTISVQEKENSRKESEARFHIMIKEQQNKIQQLQTEISLASKEAEDGKTVIRTLSSAVDNLKRDLASKDSSERKHEEEVRKFREENTISALTITTLTDEVHKLRNDIQEKEKGLSGEIQVLLVSKQELQARAEETEEMLRRSYREKAIAEERLQQEIRQLSYQMSSSCDDKDKVAMQALKDASMLRAEKGELETKIWSLQQMLTQANKDAISLKEILEFKVSEALAKESQTGKNLEDVVREVEVLKKDKLSYTVKMVELEGKCTALEEQKESMVAQISKGQNNALQNESWQLETEKSRDALVISKQEKMKVEASFKEASEELSRLKEQMKSQEETASRWKQSKAALEDKISRLQEENAKAAKFPLDEKNESTKLRKQTSDLKRKLSEQEIQREELKRSITALEDELKQKTNALAVAEKKLKDRELSANSGTPVSLISRSLSRANSKVGPMSPFRDAKELVDLRQKVKLLEVEVKRKATEVEASKRQLQEQHEQLSRRIEALESANEQLVKEHSHSNVDRLIKELTRLQDQNAALFQRENELLSKLGLQKVLQKELESLKEEKKDLENALSIFSEAAKGENVLKRVSVLETELAEVLEANNMYKVQLQSVFSKQHNVNAAALENLCSADKVITDLAELKTKNELLEEELKDMRQRYFNMSLQFAEVEAEREQLVMTIRNIRGTKKLMPFWSANFQRDNGNF